MVGLAQICQPDVDQTGIASVIFGRTVPPSTVARPCPEDGRRYYQADSQDLGDVSTYHSPPDWYVDVLAKVEELKQLPENWDSYGARRIDSATGQVAIERILPWCPPASPAPQIVPLSNGGIGFEWHEQGVDLEIQVHSPDEITFYCERAGEELEGEWDPGKVREILGTLA